MVVIGDSEFLANGLITWPANREHELSSASSCPVFWSTSRRPSVAITS
jgi:hypothetical protein